MLFASRTSARRSTRRAVITSLLALAAAGCAPRVAPAAAPAGPAGPLRATAGRPQAFDAVADEVLRRTNARRRGEGAPALARSETLMRAAQLQADQMAATGRMDHELRGTSYPTLTTRLVAVSYEMRAAGENIAMGHRDAASVVEGWMTSPGHRANILSSSYSEMGTGVAASSSGRMYYAQVFGRPLRPPPGTTAGR